MLVPAAQPPRRCPAAHTTCPPACTPTCKPQLPSQPGVALGVALTAALRSGHEGRTRGGAPEGRWEPGQRTRANISPGRVL